MPRSLISEGHTHQVENQPEALENYNAYTTDIALQEAVRREGASWAEDTLEKCGAVLGRADTLKLGFDANEYPPHLKSHDHLGRRLDQVEFHPAYHALHQLSREYGLHAEPWITPKAGAHVLRAAKGYMMNQVEASHCCPVTMTYASVPLLRDYPKLAEKWLPLITNEHYDPRNLPVEQKRGATLGMAVTEKQGGSDVYQNSTQARAVGESGSGKEYELIGHKFFVSGCMSDAFTLLAKTEKGLSCFLVPRWKEDGTKNPFEIQRLKNKMGNIANATAEVELRGAIGWLIGEEGKGLNTILKAIAYNRFDCIYGSAAGMRQAVVQAIHHCQNRVAFGKKLSDQPLMQNVLSDLIIESEAATAFAFRMARALDEVEQNKEVQYLIRIGTALGKYWICKRAAGHAYEAMECIGGSGAMEGHMMPRLYREAPINAIWEGSGNVQALDAINSFYTNPKIKSAFINELARAKGMHPNYDQYFNRLFKQLEDTSGLEFRARTLTTQMALAWQASILLTSGNDLIAHAFCLSRLSQQDHHLYGNLCTEIDHQAIINRAAVDKN
jgi:putative acyl-CoA dehydrogenase